MVDIAEHYSQVNLVQNYYSTIMLFSHIRPMELEKYATVLQVGHGKNMDGKWKNKMAAQNVEIEIIMDVSIIQWFNT